MTEISARPITVYLVDVHPIVREDCARAMDDAEDLVVVGQIGAGAGALEETKTVTPDVILVDLDTPDRDGVELVGALRAQIPATKLLISIAGDGDGRLDDALRAGANGFLLETATHREMIERIRSSVVDDAPLCIRLADAPAHAATEPTGAEPREAVEALTWLEWQVLTLLAARIALTRIGEHLALGLGTVTTLAGRIYAKLGCSRPDELDRIEQQWRAGRPPPAPAAAVALAPGPRPPSLVDAVSAPDDEP